MQRLFTSMLCALGCCLATASARADFIVPRLLVAGNAPLATTEGEDLSNVSGLYGTSLGGTGTTRLFQMRADELAALGLDVGDRITGVRSRLDAGEAVGGPAANVLVSDFEITMAQAANSIPTMSTSFAANLLNPVLVRDGPHTLLANSFTAGSSPNAFGGLVSFNLQDYTYQGGDLVFMYRRTATPGWDLDLDATRLYVGNEPEGGANANTLYRTLDDRDDIDALTGTLQRFTPVFEFVAVPEPSALVMACIAVMGSMFLPRRRSR